MSSFVDSLKFHADTLALRSRRGTVLATNIANAATPHFKARDVNFDAEMQKIAKTNVLTTTHNKHIPMAGAREGDDRREEGEAHHDDLRSGKIAR